MVEGNEPQALYFTQAPTLSVPDSGPFLSVGALCGTLTAEVERLTSLGAALVHDSPGDLRSVMMTDPEGHRFMVELSDEEIIDNELGCESRMAPGVLVDVEAVQQDPSGPTT